MSWRGRLSLVKEEKNNYIRYQPLRLKRGKFQPRPNIKLATHVRGLEVEYEGADSAHGEKWGFEQQRRTDFESEAAGR